VSVKPSVLE